MERDLPASSSYHSLPVAFQVSHPPVHRSSSLFLPILQLLKLSSISQFLCILLLLLGRLINVAVPMVLAQLISIFDGKVTQSPWPYLFGYAALRFLQGSGGLAALRDVGSSTCAQFRVTDMLRGYRLSGHLSCNTLTEVTYSAYTFVEFPFM